MVLTRSKTILYACATENSYNVTKYEKIPDTSEWAPTTSLPRSQNDHIEVMLQLKLDANEQTLFGTTTNGFIVWDLTTEESEAIVLPLPHGTRNISTIMMQSNSIVLSAKRNYAVAGVRKNLYVWSLESKQLIKILDAHFGRIMQLEALIIGNWNCVVTSSIDRSVKVWNINNIFEQVHVIDRHELPIDSISLSENLGLATTVTRSCVGIWELQVGKLIYKLADSPLGAIVTHAVLTSDAKYIISAESGHVLIWHRLTEQVIFKEEQPGIRQLTLIENGTKILTISKPSNPPGTDFVRTVATLCLRHIPDGETIYSFEYPVRSITGIPFRPAVITSDAQYVVLSAADKTNRDCIMVYNSKTGALIHRIGLKPCGIKDVNSVVAMPHKGHLIGVIATDKGAIIDIRNKKYLRTIPKWCGSVTNDGKYGLYAPARGGLELLELKKGQTVRTFIPKVAEGVFTVICMFNKTDEYVLYYHSGKKTLRVFRTADAHMIANYRVQTELSAIETTHDGTAIILGTVDGCVSVLAITDPAKPEMAKFLSTMPSRDEQWKKKVERMRAQAKFKAAASIVKLSTKFFGVSNKNNELVENQI